MFLQLDQKPKCNKLYYVFVFVFCFAHIIIALLVLFFLVLYSYFFWPLHCPLLLKRRRRLLLLLLYCLYIFLLISFIIRAQSRILEDGEAKNGQFYLKTVMRMNITVSVNKSFFFSLYGVWRYVFMSLVSFSRFPFLFPSAFPLQLAENLEIYEFVKWSAENRLHNFEIDCTVSVYSRRWLILIIQLGLLKWHAAGQF